MRLFFTFVVAGCLCLAACEPPPDPTALDGSNDTSGAEGQEIPDQAMTDPDRAQLQEQMSAALQEATRPLPAPDFSLTTMDGGTFQLDNHLGDIVVMNFWATWCAPCRREIPDLVELQEEFGDQGVQFIGVSFDQGSPDAVRDFIEEYDINYPIAIDDGTVRDKYGPIDVLPMTLVIGPKGNGRYFARGMVTAGVLRPAIQDLQRMGGADEEPPPSYPGAS